MRHLKQRVSYGVNPAILQGHDPQNEIKGIFHNQMQPNSTDLDTVVAEAESVTQKNKFLSHGCDTEPIHQLGAVQPHGLLMVLRADNLAVVQVSAGWFRVTQPAVPETLILSSLFQDWFDVSAEPARAVLGALRDRQPAKDVKFQLRNEVQLRGRFFSLATGPHVLNPSVSAGETLAHRIGPYVVVEWAPRASIEDTGQEAQIETLERLNAALSELHRSHDETEFLRTGTQALRELSGFDRVMLYRFLPDFSGEVVAESVSAATKVKFLGMRFPAGDIPPQARQLYLLNPVRALCDIEASSDELVPAKLPEGELLDQSYCTLRSMSEAHIIYLRNMGVRATMSVSLIRDGKLWGLLACHHLKPRVPPYHVRQSVRTACELVANVIAMRADDLERLNYQKRMRHISELVHDFGRSAMQTQEGLVDAGQVYGPEFLELFSATSWGVRLGGTTVFGKAQRLAVPFPGGAVMDEVERLLANQAPGKPLVANHLATLAAKFPPELDEVGMLAIRFGVEGKDVIVFFRPKLEQVIHWGGKQDEPSHVAKDGGIYLEPRRSFDLWTETVRDKSEDWSRLDVESMMRLSATLGEHSQALINHELNEKLRWRARHDFLTGLLNRSALDSELHLLMQIPGANFGLFMIDLDHFKRINDSLGHRAGDEVIKAVGHRIAEVIRDNDFACRFGGDEFIMVVHFESGKVEALLAIADRLIRVMKLPILVESDSLVMGISVGIATYPDQGPSAVDLMRRADIALYDAKARGRGVVSVYTEEMESRANEAFSLESQLREALPADQLKLYYQPKVDLRSGNVVGVEALVRWQHPVRGLLGPDHFVPIAERCGLINPLGAWVITEAVAQIARWRDQGDPILPVAINVSFAQFASANFVDELAAALSAHAVDPDLIEVELTESILMEDTGLARGVLHKLKAMGVHVTLDDFGTGYSSLSYLHQLPLSTLKIDRSFVAGLEHDAQAQLVTRAVLGLARGLRIKTVAEGVEDDYQRRWLMSHNCDQAQGYFFSRPIPPEEVHSAAHAIRLKWR